MSASSLFSSFDPDAVLKECVAVATTVATPNHKEIPRLTIHESIVELLDKFIQQNKIPHIIFHGPPGSGKLSLVREFIQRIYVDDKAKIKTHVMTVNCSHGKGIQFIREELKFFAKANTQTKSGSEFKIILLLNAHHLTVDAQSALRRCIELFSHNTRFFIVVENKNKLLNPILSRFCDIFVPEPTPLGLRQPLNLHKYVLSQQFTVGEDTRFQTIDRILSLETAMDAKSQMNAVHELYEAGISCLDLMDWLNPKNAVLHSRAVMRFHEIKPQFRCEKLLMLYMIQFIVYSS
jgi:replication-associated recombination protein RarA